MIRAPALFCTIGAVTDIAPIKRASTVVLMRDTARGPEVFMVRRTFTIAFMAGAHVFPGGRVDEADAADVSWADLPDGAAAHRAPSTAFAVSAARELFEEAGVLLARDRNGRCPATTAAFAEWRAAVHDKARSFREVVTDAGLRLALDAIVPFARWVTPPNEVRRFDTWFYLTAVPDGQIPVHDTSENVASEWLRPADAIAACVAGRVHLPPPTWATLRELEPFASVADALRWAATRSIQERSPVLTDDGATREIVMPGHPRHPSNEPVTFETRFVWQGTRWLPEADR